MKSNLYTGRGQVLVIFALVAVGLFAIVGLAIDGSNKFSDRRHAQNAADTTALAAALEKVNRLAEGKSNNPVVCPPSSGLPSEVCSYLQSTGLNRAISNGYGSDLAKGNVKIYSPPISGPYKDDPDYVQVIITSYVNTTFARVIGISQLENVVQAVALAKPGYNLAQGSMIISYDPDPKCSVGGTGGYSVSVNGTAAVTLNGGGFFLNSDEVCGFKAPSCTTINIKGGGGINTVGANNIDTTGCTYTPPLNKNYNQDPIIIPDDVVMPKEPKECSQTATAQNVPLGSDYWYISPGYYTDFPQYGINGDKIVNIKKHIIMKPGVYCVGSDIKWSGNTFLSLDGSSGVTIYIKSGYKFSFNINSPIKLDATSDPDSDYQGYLIIQNGSPTAIQSCLINGGTYLELNGLIYAPYCDFTINGGGVEIAQINAQIIGWDFMIDGKNGINFNYDPSNQVKIKTKIGLLK